AGSYLLRDGLEGPNLRARAMAWLAARLRRRPPRFGELDREGRLVALYGLLSMVWLIIAVNLAYRIYLDRVGGLVTGLWRGGGPGRGPGGGGGGRGGPPRGGWAVPGVGA